MLLRPVSCLIFCIIALPLSCANSSFAQASVPNQQSWKIADKPQKASKLLEIKPTDSWQQVIGKAVTYRQLGRIDEAISSFARYGEMFEESDPTAKQYSVVAQKFTRQMKSLDVKGGVYIYEIIAGGSAEQEGLAVGDIIISYNNQRIVNMKEFKAEKDRAAKNKSLEVVYFRLEGKKFRQYTKTVNNPMQARLMPI